MTILDVLQARRRIAPHIRRTPLVKSHWLSDLAGADVALKLESLQVSNSFKARGAFNAIIARRERAASPSTPPSAPLSTPSSTPPSTPSPRPPSPLLVTASAG